MSIQAFNWGGLSVKNDQNSQKHNGAENVLVFPSNKPQPDLQSSLTENPLTDDSINDLRTILMCFLNIKSEKRRKLLVKTAQQFAQTKANNQATDNNQTARPLRSALNNKTILNIIETTDPRQFKNAIQQWLKSRF